MHYDSGTCSGSLVEFLLDITLCLCQVAFPEASENKDVVSLRGPKEDVEKCAVYLKKLSSELVKIVIVVFARCLHTVQCAVFSQSCHTHPSLLATPYLSTITTIYLTAHCDTPRGGTTESCIDS